MPDSFTKFKEEPPKKTSSSGGSTEDSTDPTATPVPEVSDVVFSISTFDIFQSSNDTIFFSVSDATDFRVDDVVNVSTVAIGPGVNDLGRVVSVNTVEGDDDDVIAVVLSGTGIVGPNNYVQKDYFVDNCATGYNTCSVGSAAAAMVTSVASFYVSPDAPAVVGALNFNKAFTITGTSDFGFSTANLGFDYTLSPAIPLGFGFQNDTNTVQTDDAFVSPFGPFTSLAGMSFTEASPLTITASVASAQFGTQLDTEESASAVIHMASTIPGVANETSETFNLTYYLNNGDRFAIEVASTVGFSVGDTVRSCRFSVASACDQDTDEINGKATIDYIDIQKNIIFLSALSYDHDANGATADRRSNFPDNNFLTNGSFVIAQSGTFIRLLRNTDTGVSILPSWNEQNDATDNPTAVSYEISTIATGISFNSVSGEISVSNPTLFVALEPTITARNTTTGEVIDTFSVAFSSFGTVTNIVWDDGVNLNSTTLGSPIGVENDVDFGATTESGSFPGGEEGATELALDRVYYVITGDPDGAPFAFPAGTQIDQPGDDSTQATLRFTPEVFLDGTGVYTISGFHPAYDAVNPFATATISFKSATNFDRIVYPQSSGDSLIVTVDDATSFTTSSGSNFISTAAGASGTIQFIDPVKKELFITVTSNLTGNEVFKSGDAADITTSFVVERTEITKVVHVFDLADSNNRFVGPNGLVPSFFTTAGTAVPINTAVESLSWAISPGVATDMTFSTSTGAFTSNTANDIALLPETTYDVFVTPEVGSQKQTSYSVIFKETPSLASAARYQFVRLDSGGNRFFRGSKIATTGDDVLGRVLMTIDVDGDGTNDGLLLENSGDIAPGTGVDNTAKFFAAEGFVENYQFWYVKDTTGFAATNNVTSAGGDSATIVDIDSTNSRMYVKVNSGTFTSGETISFGAAETNINTVETRHYVTGVIQVDSLGTLNQFTVGGPVSSDTLGNGTDDSLGIVVEKHIDSGGGRHYLLVQHISGDFQESDQIDNTSTFAAAAGTISRIVGPNINVDISGGAVGTPSSSSAKVDSSSNPFFEGSIVGNFSRTGSNYISIGYAVAGTDFSSNRVVVNVEDYGNHFFRNTGGATAADSYIDDFTESTVTNVNTRGHNQVSNIGLSNLVITYVGEKFHLEPFVKGEFSSASLSPDENSLPDGLSFDSATGILSGTPTEPANLATYTLTFISSDGLSSTSYDFPLVIYNQFEIQQTTNSASSYVLHKEGQGLGATSCKVFGPQVIDDVNDPNYNQAIYGFNDVVCLLEGGESDLFNQGIEFDVKSGAGMCEFVQYTPFSYDAFLPGASNREITLYNNFDEVAGCAAGAADTINYVGNAFGEDRDPDTPGVQAFIDSAQFGAGNPLAGRAFASTYCETGDCIKDNIASNVCSYDYSLIDDDYPNMDSGSVTVNTVTCNRQEVEGDDDPGNGLPNEVNCSCQVAVSEIECNGATTNGLAGAKRSSSLDVGEVSIITNAFVGTTTGADIKQEIEAPINRGHGTNHYITNYVASRNYAASAANSCYESDYHFESYGTTAGTLTTNRQDWASYSSSVDPFGSSSTGAYDNFYTFNCLDAAFNIKARVRVIVRDWDKEFTPEDVEITQLSPAAKLDDITTTCFGQSCDDFFDFDTIWSSLGLADTSAPVYTACGDSTTSVDTLSRTITIEAGNISATLSGALAGTESVANGSVFYIENGDTGGFQEGEDKPLQVFSVSVSGTTVTFATSPSFSAAAADVYMVRKIPYPMRGFEQ